MNRVTALLMLIVWTVAVTGTPLDQKIRTPLLLVLALLALLVFAGAFPFLAAG